MSKSKKYTQEQLEQCKRRGQQLRKMRESLGWFQPKVAEILGVSVSLISYAESGKPSFLLRHGPRMEAIYREAAPNQPTWEVVDEEEDVLWDTNQSSKSHEQQEEPEFEEEEPLGPEEGLEQVAFNGQVLTGMRQGDQVWISVRRICEAMGVAYGRQSEKIQSHPALNATVHMTRTVAGDGKSRDMLLIPLGKVAFWLGTIHPNRVSEKVRPALVKFQNECAEVLERHFFGQKQQQGQQQQSSSFGLHELLAVLAEQNKQIAEQNRQSQKETLLLVAQILGTKEAQIKDEVKKDTQEAAREAAKQAIQQEQQKAREEMREEDFIPPVGPPRPLSLRADINKRVETYVNVTMGGIGYSESYNRLYSQFEARYRIDLKRRASEETERRKRKAAGGQMSFSIEDEPADRKKEYPYYPKDAKGTKVAPMDIAQWMGCLVDLHALACELFHIGPNEGGKEGGEQYAA